ncbi:hypothetical protein ARGLB_010_00230 [Arthrobacter globiformis NBRC 12137]|uniref:Uncharacterized protein n=1 Tax=Arthrobacter globiformis (strain ATCC 8010 / DSM 20124 / JCM 1332 / NBRC 12137 / NCIMB 8907 / NRRL B-2979 / 168) TaxID=1077972 RepID=H0QH87_ARTG1|nr:hypothetical protein ARGLB_010_00230 [Arthrobacter globiformis NBRC 12137]
MTNHVAPPRLASVTVTRNLDPPVLLHPAGKAKLPDAGPGVMGKGRFVIQRSVGAQVRRSRRIPLQWNADPA